MKNFVIQILLCVRAGREFKQPITSCRDKVDKDSKHQFNDPHIEHLESIKLTFAIRK